MIIPCLMALIRPSKYPHQCHIYSILILCYSHVVASPPSPVTQENGTGADGLERSALPLPSRLQYSHALVCYQNSDPRGRANLLHFDWQLSSELAVVMRETVHARIRYGCYLTLLESLLLSNTHAYYILRTHR